MRDAMIASNAIDRSGLKQTEKIPMELIF